MLSWVATLVVLFGVAMGIPLAAEDSIADLRGCVDANQRLMNSYRWIPKPVLLSDRGLAWMLWGAGTLEENAKQLEGYEGLKSLPASSFLVANGAEGCLWYSSRLEKKLKSLALFSVSCVVLGMFSFLYLFIATMAAAFSRRVPPQDRPRADHPPVSPTRTAG